VSAATTRKFVTELLDPVAPERPTGPVGEGEIVRLRADLAYALRTLALIYGTANHPTATVDLALFGHTAMRLERALASLGVEVRGLPANVKHARVAGAILDAPRCDCSTCERARDGAS